MEDEMEEYDSKSLREISRRTAPRAAAKVLRVGKRIVFSPRECDQYASPEEKRKINAEMFEGLEKLVEDVSRASHRVARHLPKKSTLANPSE